MVVSNKYESTILWLALRTASVVMLMWKEFPKIWYEHSLGLKDELIYFGGRRSKITVTTQNTPFLRNSHTDYDTIYSLV